jgi:hypothetical protein
VERLGLEELIRDAFAGVSLGAGVSLRQAAAIDVYFEGWTRAQFDRLPESEVTHDWTQIPDDELRRDNVAHLDPEGLRYYLPALMLWLLDHYNNADERLLDSDADLSVIGTISALAPGKDFREHQYGIYDAFFSQQQRCAIAAYVEALPGLVELGWEDTALLERSLRDYWGQFLAHEG